MKIKALTFLALIGGLTNTSDNVSAISLQQPSKSVSKNSAKQLAQKHASAPAGPVQAPKAAVPKQMAQVKSKSNTKKETADGDAEKEVEVEKKVVEPEKKVVEAEKKDAEKDGDKKDEKKIVKEEKTDDKKAEAEKSAKEVESTEKKEAVKADAKSDDKKADAKTDDKKDEKVAEKKEEKADEKKDDSKESAQKKEGDSKADEGKDKSVVVPKDSEKKESENKEQKKDDKKEEKKEEEDESFEGYTDFDKDFLDTHNKMRTDPTSLVPELEKMAAAFDGMGRYVMMDGMKTKLMTQEGAAPVKELIAFLKKQTPLKALKLAKDLKGYSCTHVKDQGPSGQTGHSATDGTSFGDRIGKLMVPNFVVGENISYGSAKGHDAAVQLAIDDGVPGRGHRTNMFKADYAELGPCEGPHKGYRNMAVGIYRGPSTGGSMTMDKASDKTESAKATATKASGSKCTAEQKKQIQEDEKADAVLTASVEKKDDKAPGAADSKDTVVVLTLEPESVKHRLQAAGAPPSTIREVYKILGIEWNDKDEEWFGNMPKKYLDMWNGKEPEVKEEAKKEETKVAAPAEKKTEAKDEEVKEPAKKEEEKKDDKKPEADKKTETKDTKDKEEVKKDDKKEEKSKDEDKKEKSDESKEVKKESGNKDEKKELKPEDKATEKKDDKAAKEVKPDENSKEKKDEAAPAKEKKDSKSEDDAEKAKEAEVKKPVADSEKKVKSDENKEEAKKETETKDEVKKE